MTVIEPGAIRRSEVVVIGSGPGGAVLATALAQAGKEVLLIEEGLNLPQDSCDAFSFEEMKLKYRAGGITAAFGKPNVAYAEGSCVGGGSEVNSGLYHRTPAHVFEEWSRDFGVADISADNMLPYFEACEAIMQPQGYTGELPVASQILRRGAEKEDMPARDIPRLVDFRDEHDEQGIARSQRRSMSRTFLPEFFAAGGRLLPETRVLKLAKRGNLWELRTRTQQAGEFYIDADNVFVCCGAIHSPALLRRSGIKTNVGRSLSLQPMVKLTAEFDEDVNFSGMGIAGEQVKPDPGYSFGCAISSQAHLSINLANDWDGTRYAVEKHRKLISYYVMSRGTLDGSVSAIPGFDDPLVRYQTSLGELRNLGKGMQGLARLLLSSGARVVHTGLSSQPLVTTHEQADALPSRLPESSDNLMTIHLMGSCPMGEDRRRAAVDSYGRVHGYHGLYVSDVSTVCTSLGVNPQGTIMALSQRNADHFLNA